jgi:hypothetical protein
VNKAEYEGARLEAARERMAGLKRVEQISETQWLLHNPGRSEGHMYISILGRAVVCWGDYDLCAFAYAQNHESALQWVASMTSTRYMCEKASIGMGYPAREYSVEAAESDLAEMIEDETDEADKEVLRIAFDYTTSQELLHNYLAENLTDGWEIAGGLGMIVSQRVAIAHAAVRRLVELQKERGQ